jgi:hypothetical protein
VRTYRPLHSYLMHRPCTTLDISQRGLLACGFGRCACLQLQRLVTVPLATRVAAAVATVAKFLNSHVEVWKDSLSTKQKEPYLSHHFAGAAAAATAAYFRVIW